MDWSEPRRLEPPAVASHSAALCWRLAPIACRLTRAVMPEGDTLWRSAAALRERIGGKTCLDVRPMSFQRLIGQRVTDVESKGKHLFIRFDSGLAIHSHLRMRGAWYVHRPGEPLQRPDHEVTVLLTFDDWIAVLFAAPVAEIVAGEHTVHHLGPDILSDGFDATDVAGRIVLNPDRLIGEVLLDQRVCAGIGNIYKCESLWQLRINPWVRAGDLDEPTVVRLYETAARSMRRSAFGQFAARRRDVHARGGQSCRRCSHMIQVKSQGDPPRLTYWCPNCQRAG